MFKSSTAFDGLLAERILKRGRTDETSPALGRSDTLDGYVKRATETMVAATRDSDRYTKILAHAMTLPHLPMTVAALSAMPSRVTTAAALAGQYVHASIVDAHSSMVNAQLLYPVVLGAVPTSIPVWPVIEWVSKSKRRLQDLVSEIDAPSHEN